MQYSEYTLRAIPPRAATLSLQEFYDIASTYLGEQGFESFVVEEELLRAYILSSHAQSVEDVLPRLRDALDPLFPGWCWEGSMSVMPDKNWNEEWERNYFQPIVIDEGRCVVRAPFHSAYPEAKVELIISPKMAFGTGNHETTSLVLSRLLEMNLSGKRVLDMGCGTGILGLLALKRGASYLSAIDIDEWACHNVEENAELNGLQVSELIQGDAQVLKERGSYDLVVANIMRNVLLEDMPAYTQVMTSGAHLLLSGFYEVDVSALVERGKSLGLRNEGYRTRGQWAMLELSKP